MRRLVACCSAVLFAAALLAGCASSSSKGAAGANRTTTSPASEGGGKFAPPRLAGIGKQKFKISYSVANGSTQTYAQDGRGNTVTIDGDAQVYTTRTAIISCQKSTDTFTCTQSPVGLGANSAYAAISAAEKTYVNALRNHFGVTSTKTIAGRRADCFTVTAKDFEGSSAVAAAAAASLKGSATNCNDSETGALLENSLTDESGATTTNLLVTKFESPSASDFKPPATPTIVTIPGVGPITAPGGVSAQ